MDVLKKIKNYFNKQLGNGNSSGNDNSNFRNKLMCLFYSNINMVPIAKEISQEEYNLIITSFPDYFTSVSKKEILNIFNNEVSSKKPLYINYNFIYNYDIKDGNVLPISPKTFRPIYTDNWKEEAENTNGILIKYQLSFYADYLRYYLRFKQFPSFDEYLLFIYNKYKKPVHKDILNAYNNITKSYEPIHTYIKTNNLEYKEIKKTIIKSASISNRIEIQNKTNDLK